MFGCEENLVPVFATFGSATDPGADLWCHRARQLPFMVGCGRIGGRIGFFDLYSDVLDPFGIHWAFARDLTQRAFCHLGNRLHAFIRVRDVSKFQAAGHGGS